ncbi:MAG: DNA polymerase III subunit alpha, partial [Lentisphaerae bacterium]|nr:DNA polymerase III subunit alpha [Lentisphaerota bacterium]
MPDVNTRQFVHLHFHTCYSLLDGACRIDRTMDFAEENNMPALAITDHGVMYGAIDFYKQAKKRGIKPIIGCETYVTLGDRTERKTESGRTPMHHLVLLATDTTGYHNLVKLVSAAHLEGFYYKPRIDKELLAQHHSGLIGLSACLKGEVASALSADRPDAALKIAGEYADILGKDNFFLEIQDHRLPDQRRVNRHLPGLAARAGIPLVATNDVHYLKAEHAPAHEVLLAMQTQTVLSDPKRMRYGTDEFYMKTRAEMELLFGEMPEVLDRTLDIAERCNVEIEFGRPHFPTFDVPDGMTQKEYLVSLCREGLQRLFDMRDPAHPANAREKEIIDRFDHELSVIERTGYVNYYLVVWDFVHYARTSGIPVGPGRGSGGGSLLAYLLGITAIDPLEHGLIFERFLNPERVSPPDFDIDFCQARREEVITYVKNKYGSDHVAQIITFGSLGAKSVIRDVGRVLEIPYARCDQLAKLVPEDPKMNLELALQQSPEFRKTYETDADCKRILDYAFVLEGLYRNPGTHAAGVVIGEKPLVEILPLSLDKEKQPITQYTMEPLGEIGLLKMDFLGLKTLTVIRETVNMVRETQGIEVDIENLPMDDAPTYKLLNRGDTIGVFQLESPGMRDLVRRIGIESLQDLIAMIALYRPGPMNMLDDFVSRKTGKTPIKYDHELLEPILNETYGVMLYQEEVMKAANVLAGYSLGQADILRKAMGKKNQVVMEQQRATFIEGCHATNKIDAKHAGRIFDSIAQFAGYGFPKAHSTGYGIIAYQTAYLKANYLAEFMSSLISGEIGHFDKLPVFVREAGNMGLEILPPDVNESGERFRPRGTAVRYGLAGIKNVGAGAARAIVDEREKNGAYSGLVDLCGRIDSQTINKKVLESLIRSGACDGWKNERATVFHGVDFAMARAADKLHDKQSGQGSLFDLLD